MHPSGDHQPTSAPLDSSELAARLAWEHDARLAAEALNEKKSQEIFEAKKELEDLLSGSVKMLSDVLAMARPELFQKAAKIQRWARQIAPKLKVERPWELDLAAMLYPLGAISLPDDLAMKYVLCEPMDVEEKREVDECSQTAYELISNIPRMQRVAEAVLYSRKGYDGSGHPQNGIQGDKIPQNARILKILIDLADGSMGAGVTRSDGFMGMASCKHEYDLDILKVAYIALLEEENPGKEKRTSLSLSPAMLKAGDILLKDVVDKNNGLLLAAGSELSDLSIKRLQAMVIERQVKDKFLVQRR